jgi:CheY-like chemotaxis protein
LFGKTRQEWVEVESEVDQGSTFRVFLPAAAEEVAPPVADAVDKPVPGGRETILLVEDEAKVRQLIARALQILGYRVYEAENGQQAMRLWQEHGAEVNLLLTDMVMPKGMTGLELAERLREMKPDLEVIISSGYSMEFFQAGGLQKSGISYLPKPCEVKTLASMVRGSLDAHGQP